MTKEDWYYQYQLYRNVALITQLKGIAAKMQELGYGREIKAKEGFKSLPFERNEKSRKSPLQDA